MPLYGVLGVYPYKIPPNAEKRRIAHLHRKWEYKTPEFVRRGWTNGNAYYIYNKYGYIKIVIYL